MTKTRKTFALALMGSLGMLLVLTTPCGSKDKSVHLPSTGGIYLKLTEDFYRALKEDAVTGTRSYSTARSDEYLREIAVSARFMVETNLQIIKQQETIIRLLESAGSRKK